ncbi:hypothetical protein BIV24_08390 [Streptomyces colonosanans]|uniref:Uncharacterized protein n=1 Tax=Streptomyces colonosanans TaxID=1428652 RepID=A0A1S2PQD7_9ACTN|nr:hypothetical protein BIV24_08390 [Streptomyces colonosanans]
MRLPVAMSGTTVPAPRHLDGCGLDPGGGAQEAGDGVVGVLGPAAGVEDAGHLVEVVADAGELRAGGHRFRDASPLVQQQCFGAALGLTATVVSARNPTRMFHPSRCAVQAA